MEHGDCEETLETFGKAKELSSSFSLNRTSLVYIHSFFSDMRVTKPYLIFLEQCTDLNSSKSNLYWRPTHVSKVYNSNIINEGKIQDKENQWGWWFSLDSALSFLILWFQESHFQRKVLVVISEMGFILYSVNYFVDNWAQKKYKSQRMDEYKEKVFSGHRMAATHTNLL